MICQAPVPERPGIISVAEARLLLGPKACTLTDDQVRDMIAAWDVVAELALERVKRAQA